MKMAVWEKWWRAMGQFFVKAWRATVSWKGWKVIFAVPAALLAVLAVLCAAGLIFVFLGGYEQQVWAYLLYTLSAYVLTALCVKLPGALGRGKRRMEAHPRLMAVLHNRPLLFTAGLYFDQFINFVYGVFKLVLGVLHGSAWIGADGIYNFVQAMIQLFQILRRRRGGSMVQQWQSYRVCGGLILLMHLSLTGIVFQTVNWGRWEERGGYLIFATAAFAFYKIISSFIRVARDRKHPHPIDSSVRMMELSQAIFAIFSLQASLLHEFGTGEAWEGILNAVTGCVVCLLVASMGIYMIRRGKREIRKIQEDNNGESRIL